jgi:hypothetical protein
MKHIEYLKGVLIEKHGPDRGAEILAEISTKFKIHNFLQDLPANERLPRAFGQFAHLIGLECPTFDKEVHVIEPFKVPPHWPVTAMVDIHPSTPQAIAFYATDEIGYNYAVAEVFENMHPSEVADTIIRYKRLNSWRLGRVWTDPLAKGDEKYAKNRVQGEDAFTIMKRTLNRERILLDTASKDRNSGVMAVQTGLMGPNKMPSLRFFKTCVRHVWEIMRWKPDNASEMHMMENLYRYLLIGVVYSDPQIEQSSLGKPDKGII